MISVLNSLSAMTSDDTLSQTDVNLNKTLTELSTGRRVNDGSDDPAGLSISTGMQANIAALTQSAQNAVNGIGLLQTADGALSQVTTLLYRAVTLATEATNVGVTTGKDSQMEAMNGEFQTILAEIGRIGQTTEFNGSNVFTANAPTTYTSTHIIQGTSTLTPGSITTISDWMTGGVFIYNATATSTVDDLDQAIAQAASTGTLSAGTSGSVVNGRLVITTTTPENSIQVSSTVAGSFTSDAGGREATVFVGDGSQGSGDADLIEPVVEALSPLSLNLNGSSLVDPVHSAQALGAVVAAISKVALQRAQVGVSMNSLMASSAMSTIEVQNLTSASNGIVNSDVGKTVAKLAEYNVLQSTGMVAVQKANEAQQAVLTLIK